MTSSLAHVLSHGYFPKELPPPFNTLSFGTFADVATATVMRLDTSKKGLKANVVSKPATHNLARAGMLRRKLAIPNPVNQFQIAYAVTREWATLKKACAKSSFH